MIKVGITGGIGGGKSTFCNMLRKKGFLVYDTDKQAAFLQNSNELLIQQIKTEFGDGSYQEDGQLNRKYLASVVFNNPLKLLKLNAIVHPAVKKDLIGWYDNNCNAEVLFVECAILFEGGFDQLVDKVLLVTADEKIRIKRVMERDSITQEEVMSRMQRQLPEQLKMSKSDFIVHSDAGLKDENVDNFLKTLLSR